MIETNYVFIYEAIKKIISAQTYEELNEIAFKYWGTFIGRIRGINNIILMSKIVEERRKELETGMDNK